MNLLKAVKRKTLVSEIAYYLLNLALVVILFVLSRTVGSPVAALALVVVSKWRVFAVRPRHWWSHVQANAVDIIVGLGIVSLMYLPQASLAAQSVAAIVYALWLLIIKPWSKRWQMTLQSAIALFIGTTALMSVSYEWPVLAVVAAMFVIGYSCSFHFLHSYDEDQTVLLSGIWGIVFAEVGWLMYGWNFSYALPGLSPIFVPQTTIILLLLSFVAERVYRSWHKNHSVTSSEVLAPVILSMSLIAVMLLFFNSVII